MKEQIVDEFQPFFWLKKDPYLVGIAVRVTDETKVDEVKQRLLETFEKARSRSIDDKRLADVKSRAKYSFLQSLDSPNSIASNLAFMLSLDPSLESVDNYYEAMENVDQAQLTDVAERVFRPQGRTIVTLEVKEKDKK